jgi:hypothetical protein
MTIDSTPIINKKKVNKSVSLNADVYERLVSVCELLGVNVNAYLVNAVGQQLFRDEAPVKAQNEMIRAMTTQVSEHLSSDEFQAQAESVAIKINNLEKENPSD